MSGGDLRIMLPTTVPQNGQPRMYSPYEARSEYASRAAHPLAVRHQPMELPQPHEPRSSHHFRGPSAHDATPRHMESNGYRPSGQTLPGLRDIILAPTSHSSPQPPQSAWSQPPVPRYEQRNIDPPSSHPSGSHPPHIIHPPSEPHTSYPVQNDRRLDLPILDTTPVPRPQLQGPAIPSYATHHGEGREMMDARYERPRQTSSSSYMTAGAPSPYTPLTGEHVSHRNSNASYDRSGNPPFTPTGPEASKKYLGIKDFPGEGTFHVYDGGYRIPTSVDGETVNPQWGLTKANKPRKRLALACLDCREKKIKCEPGASSCLQCEKAKRPCRRAQNQTLTTDSAGNPQWTSEAGSPPLAPHSQLPERMAETNSQNHRPVDPAAATKNNRMSDQDPFSKRRAQDEEANGGASVKRHQSMSPSVAYGHHMATSQPQFPHYTEHRVPRAAKGSAFMSWEDDPYFTDPDATVHLLEEYFANVNSGTYCMFPRVTFMNWLTTAREKCQNERMVLYAMLAMGSVFAAPGFSSIGKRCAELATEGLASKVGRFSLPVIHVRLLLALYNFAKGNEGAAWEYCGLAIRAISALRYNHEEGCLISPKKQDPILEYGMTREQVMECRRRTFWAGFLMDRYNGFCGGMLCVINPADVYLRLPCADDAYESSMASVAPFYNNGSIDRTLTVLNASSPVSPMAWLSVAGGIWGEAMNFIYRANNHSRNTYREAYEKIYHDTHSAMDEWASQLPGYLRYSEANLDRSIQDGYAGTFISLHVLHHFVLMKLNRCMRHTLAADLAPRNIRTAHHHAHRLLGVMRAVRESRREIVHPRSGQSQRFALAVPFAGYATLSAVDIVGGGGPDSTLGPTMAGMESGVDCLRELAQYWNSAVEQTRSAERRHYQLKNVLSRPYKAASGCWLGRNWGLEGPLEQEFELDADCIYGVDNKVYFNALEDDAANGRARA